MFAYSYMHTLGLIAEILRLLDIVDRKINVLAQKAKDLGGIQRDETGSNWL
jgi:hypothetical protein